MDIASLLGLSEETVCRLMANMKRTGVIYAPRGNIEIRDWEHLQAIADGAASEHAAA
jgi:DNA-binding Lrp family transcriptional regulator